MSAARDHVHRTLQRLAAEAAARAEAEANAAPKAARPTLPPAEEPRVGPTTARASVAAKVRAKRFAAIAAAAANDNAGERSDSDMAGPYGQMLLQLTEDKRKLKALQSTEAKVALKAELLPAYVDYVDGVLQASRETGEALQDEVLMTVMVWRIDAGDFMGALTIADHAFAYGLNLPPQFNRTTACLVAEEIADSALAAQGEARIPVGVLELTAQLVDGRDMPDQVRAKLLKAQAEEMAWLADHPPEGHGVAGWRPNHLQEALDLYNRALKLNSKVGVKKEVERLERELKKEGDTNAP